MPNYHLTDLIGIDHVFPSAVAQRVAPSSVRHVISGTVLFDTPWKLTL
jgi:hypothetical protein